MNMKEALKNRIDGHEVKISTAFVVLIAAAGAIAVTDTVQQHSPLREYSKNFTDDGKCLEGTPFDAGEGAKVTLEAFKGEDVVKVVPEDANNVSPSVLYITEVDTGWNGFGDYQTAQYLVDQGCTNIPDGF